MTIIRHFRNSNSRTWIRDLVECVIVWAILEYVCETKLVTKNDHNLHKTAAIQPLLRYEQLRRRIRQNTQEMWNYFSSELGKICQNSGTTNYVREKIRNILELGAEYKRSLISDIDQMCSVDGYDIWRHQEAEDLSELVQRRLSYIQNPLDCKNARKLLCNLNVCGYGCQLHRVVNCFIVAYATRRTMILNSKDWRYGNGEWKEVFQPVSHTCVEYDINQLKKWPGTPTAKLLIAPYTKLLELPNFGELRLMFIPDDLAPRLMKLHGDPLVWWISQFLKYLLKPKHETQNLLEIGMEKLGWKKPIVGVHIRRTDKVTDNEKAFHSIEEYMPYVEDYYLTLEMNNLQKIERRVFLATDDPSVIKEVRTKYPQYKIIADTNVSKLADVSTRFTDSSLNGIILDIHMLSLSDYLVCTFSSNVCRAAYEIMQTFYPDASERFKSLDDIYFFIPLFPSFKDKHKFETLSLPTYSNVD